MTSKERIRAAAKREKTDMLPVGFKATDDVLARLKTHFGTDEVIDLLRHLPVDTHGNFNNALYGVYPEYVGGPPKVLYPDLRSDGTWDTVYGFKRHWAPVKGGRTDELVYPLPLADAETTDEVDRYEWPQASWFDYSSIKSQCEEASDYAVIFNVGGLSTIANLIGYERMYSGLYLEPEVVHRALGRIADFYLELADRVFEAADGGIDITVIHDDFGTQNGPLMRVEMFREFWKPHLKRYFDCAHRHGVMTMMHSCGAVFEFIPEFIEAGADVIDPVQTTAAGMEPERLVSRYGADVCFHGGIDTQQLLATGTPAQVREHVDWIVESFSDADGFILAPSHYIQGDVPLVNVLTLFGRIAEIRAR